MINLKLILIAVSLISILGVGVVIKSQNDKIEILERDKIICGDVNARLAQRIEEQNEQLRIAQEKYDNTQRQLDVAAGKNQALSVEFGKLRNEWNKTPPPKTCNEAVVELKQRVDGLITRWNKK